MLFKRLGFAALAAAAGEWAPFGTCDEMPPATLDARDDMAAGASWSGPLA